MEMAAERGEDEAVVAIAAGGVYDDVLGG